MMPISLMPTASSPDAHEFGNASITRDAIFANVLAAANDFQPMAGQRYTLALKDAAYEGPDKYTKEDEKKALLSGGSLGRRLRGTWQLLDTPTGKPVDERRLTLGTVPYMTNRGTFIFRGNDYGMSNQMRLRPGIFTREKESGELESHINVARGRGHHYLLDPESGIFSLSIGQAKLPLVSVLKTMGATDSQIREAWGNDLFVSNMHKDNPAVLRKLYSKFYKDAAPVSGTREDAVRKAFEQMTLDPEVTKRTLGKPYDKVDVDTMLAATAKLLRVYKGEDKPDDRDALVFQRTLGPEDIFAERIKKANGATRRMLWRAAVSGTLQRAQPGVFEKSIRGALLDAGLANAIEEINPAELYDQLHRVTRMGEGGIASIDSIPDDSRQVQPSQLGFVDPLHSPESARIGVDNRIASNTLRGKDGSLYSQFIEAKTGRTVWRSPQQVADTVVAFPGELESGRAHVRTISGGKHVYQPKDKVDYQLKHMSHAFGPLANLIPLKAAAFPQRVSMGSRMLTQALPLVDAEAPFVQSGIPGEDRSFEESFGERMGAVRSEHAGTIVDVSPTGIKIRDTQRRVHDVELYNQFPHNRKTFLHNTPVVNVGDRVKPGQLLAASNFTDKNGVTALGKNARVAYLPYKGFNYEDAIVISESFAKRMSSTHMYQNDLDLDSATKVSKNAFISIFPGKYKKELLDKYDTDGVVKVGETVSADDPLILAVKERRTGPKIGRRARAYGDATVTWDHHTDGIVTDVHKGKKGINVIVKSIQPTQVGDKFCFDPETALLTQAGWKNVAAITKTDVLATLNLATEQLEWHQPDATQQFQHNGKMYKLQTKHLDMLVTPEHELWVSRPGKPYGKVKAKDFYESKGEWQFKKDCNWQGQEQQLFCVEYVRRTSQDNAFDSLPMDVWLEFLGYYIAEGRTTRTTGGGYQTQISQFTTSPHWQAIADCLDDLGLYWVYLDNERRFVINSKCLYLALADCGNNAYTKRVPEYVQALSPRQLRIFFDAYMDGDGHRGGCWEYGTSSEQLSFDLEVVLLKLGWCGSTRKLERNDNFQKRPHWRTRVNRRHLRPWWKKYRATEYESVVEDMVDYDGMVYCVTVANHLVYAKRGAKSYWSGNSGRYG
jgi:biotin carboxyl carrier protein